MRRQFTELLFEMNFLSNPNPKAADSNRNSSMIHCYYVIKIFSRPVIVVILVVMGRSIYASVGVKDSVK